MSTESSPRRQALAAAAKVRREAKKAEYLAEKAKALKAKPVFVEDKSYPATKAQKAKVVPAILDRISVGYSLVQALAEVEGSPTRLMWNNWLRRDPELTKEYSEARLRGYLAMAEDLHSIADTPHIGQTRTETRDQNGVSIKVVEEDMLGHRNLQIGTRKWLLTKMLPKVFGDKITQEVSGPDGQPVAVSSMDLRGLNDEELETMHRLMLKASMAK